ncbi:hypothetical protein [Variovorax saccharolyticus]|uniref:hypothetical protein n=1 Tax=Variovorax saccharolyticus TaxID=3053516 RepID=UPI00257630EE|nr:hypothetical protein [Variovorax sp. J31P216]MDM0029899.1 hypothetical protein [Variovorax sp. J31P216]
MDTFNFPSQMLDTAVQFMSAARQCGKVNGQDVSGEWLPYPQVVNFAFAAEIALKALHVVHLGKPMRGHDLEALCNALPPEVTARVCGPDMNQLMFGERLHAVRDAFEVWRYAYEKDSIGISVDFLARLAQSAIDTLMADRKAMFGV